MQDADLSPDDGAGPAADPPVDPPANPESEVTARQRRILAIVADKGFATVDALAREFDVSAQSIRRDIIRLDRAGLLQRFHGGAGPREATVRLGYAEKRSRSPEPKRLIADRLAAMVPDGASLFLDVGTTVEAVARALLGHSGLRIVTTSLPVAMVFAGHPTVEVIVAGGILRGADGSLIGDMATAALGRFRVDFAVIGFSGIDDDATLMDYDLQKVAVKQAALAAARRTIAVGEAVKLRRSALVRVASPAQLECLVTDAPPPRQVSDLFEAASVRILVG